jgi:hypothetical protein
VRCHAGKAGIAHDECAKERYQGKLTEMGADERLAALLEILQRDGRVEVALAGRRLTVMPLSLHAATVLPACGSVRLLMPGGETRPGELAMAGSLAG